jgi:hypothetical protein
MTKTRGGKGEKSEALPVPAECMTVRKERTKLATTKCDMSLICQRCHRCLYHCTCIKDRTPKPRLTRGRHYKDENQPALCEAPNLKIEYLPMGKKKTCDTEPLQ